MKSNPILDEVWHIKDDLAREAGYDLHQLCENIRKWAETHPRSGPVLNTADALRAWVRQQEINKASNENLALKEQGPPKY